MFFIHKVQSKLYHGVYISQTENPVIPHLCMERESLPYPRSTSLRTALLICKGGTWLRSEQGAVWLISDLIGSVVCC